MIEIANFCDAFSNSHSMLESYDMEMTAFLDKSDVIIDMDSNTNERSDRRLKQNTVEEFITTKSSNSKGYQSRSKRVRRNKYARFLDDDSSDSDGNNGQDTTTDEGKSTATHSKATKIAGSQLAVLHSDTDDENLNDKGRAGGIKENRISLNSDDDCYINEKLNNVKDNESISELQNQHKNVLAEVTNCNKDKIDLKCDIGTTKINSDNNVFKELQLLSDEIANIDDDVSDELMSSLPEVEFICKKQEVTDVQEFEKDDDFMICPPPEIDYMLLNKIGDGCLETLKNSEIIETDNKLISSGRCTNQVDTTGILPKAHQTVTPVKAGNDLSINLFDDDIDDSLLLCVAENDYNPCDGKVTPNHANHQDIKGSEKEQNSIAQPVTKKVPLQQNRLKTDQTPRPSMKLTSRHARVNSQIEKDKSPSNKAISDSAEVNNELISNVATPQLFKTIKAPKRVH